ncbi:PEPxxWA-CTERM sorting domain-containing protein, partial [uncultured Phenylobacterium sp.]|uniref:PEPxxWA-CTERM sorting domain-containing protein n=1 Tax=uncultured Phenylobacterium sp. TaxID=349273 RepID=UPI0025DF7033
MRAGTMAAAAAVLVAAVAGSGSAQAAYFVNAVAQLGSEVDGGQQTNGPTSATASVGDGRVTASVDLTSGQVKSYTSFYGPDSPSDFGSSAGVFGDQVTFSGNGPVNFSFGFDGQIDLDVYDPENTSTIFFLVTANLRVFNAGSGANSSNFVSHGGALVSDSFNWTFRPTDSFSMSFDELLQGSTLVSAGGTYDVFASFSPAVALNGHDADVTMDFSQTATFGITPDDPGVKFTSASGALLGSAQTMAAVPEPGTWALMIAGFGLAGAGLRRRRAALA